MPPTIGGKSIPYDSGQSGTASPDEVLVTMAPAKMSNSVDAAVSFVMRRSHAGVARASSLELWSVCFIEMIGSFSAVLQPAVGITAPNILQARSIRFALKRAGSCSGFP